MDKVLGALRCPDQVVALASCCTMGCGRLDGSCWHIRDPTDAADTRGTAVLAQLSITYWAQASSPEHSVVGKGGGDLAGARASTTRKWVRAGVGSFIPLEC